MCLGGCVHVFGVSYTEFVSSLYKNSNLNKIMSQLLMGQFQMKFELLFNLRIRGRSWTAHAWKSKEVRVSLKHELLVFLKSPDP